MPKLEDAFASPLPVRVGGPPFRRTRMIYPLTMQQIGAAMRIEKQNGTKKMRQYMLEMMGYPHWAAWLIMRFIPRYGNAIINLLNPNLLVVQGEDEDEEPETLEDRIFKENSQGWDVLSALWAKGQGVLPTEVQKLTYPQYQVVVGDQKELVEYWERKLKEKKEAKNATHAN